MSRLSEKNGAFIAISAIIGMLAIAFLYQGQRSNSQTIAASITSQSHGLQNTIANLQQFSFQPYHGRLKNLLTSTPAIGEAVLQQDRQLLYEITLPKYEALRRENSFLHVMHFHKPDGTTLLRMHRPDFFDDDLRHIRPIIDTVHALQEPQSGFEIGRSGAFFRIVEPIFVKGVYAGALELGIQAEQLTTTLKQQTGLPVAAYFLATSWAKVTISSPFEQSRHYEPYLLLSQAQPLFEKLPTDFQLTAGEHTLQLGGSDYIVHIHPIFKNFRNKPLGGIVLLQDISPLMDSQRLFMRQGIIFSLIMLLVALVALYFSFGTIMDNLLRERDHSKSLASKLERNKTQLQTIFDSSPAAIFIHRLDGTIVDLNQTMLEMYGVDKQTGLHLSISEDYSSNKNNLSLLPGYWQQVATAGYADFEWLARRPGDGSTFPVHVQLRKVLFADEELVFASVLNITARKKIEEQLASEQERMAVTLRSIGDGLIATNLHGDISLLNSVAEQLCGWPQHEATGCPIGQVFSLQDNKGNKLHNPALEVLNSGQPIRQDRPVVLLHRSGSQRLVTIAANPIFNRQQEIMGAVLVFRDETEQQQIEEELLKARKLESVGVLAGGIAHDFNNILTAIVGNINLATHRLPADSQITELLSEAEKASMRARDLTSKLLTFSKGGEPIKENASIAELVRDSADFILSGSSISCHYTIPEEIWVATIDKIQISQVI